MINYISRRWVVCLAVLFTSFIQNRSMAQCNYTAPATVVLNHTTFTAGASIQYYLVGADGKIKYVSANTSFSNVASGVYTAYAYVGAAGNTVPTNATVGALWSTVSQSCMIAKATTIHVCAHCSGSSTWSAINTGQATTGYTSSYALVNTATGNIVDLQASPSFTAQTTAGSYQIWAINYSGPITGFAIGQPINGVTGTCLDKTAGPEFNVCTILPVKFTSFTLSKNGIDANIKFITATEINVKEFIIERNKVGTTEWVSIATIAALGTGGNGSNYTFTDKQVAAGTYQYRIKTIDIDGKNNFSDVRIVKFDALQTISLLTNPVADLLTVINIPVHTQLKIVNMFGTTLAVVNNASVTTKINTSVLAAGTYLLTAIIDNKKVVSIKFVKQ